MNMSWSWSFIAFLSIVAFLLYLIWREYRR
jgi:hypothetical protein